MKKEVSSVTGYVLMAVGGILIVWSIICIAGVTLLRSFYSNRTLFLIIGFFLLLFGFMVNLLQKKQSASYPEDGGEIKGKTHSIFRFLLGISVLILGIYGLIRFLSYPAGSEFAAVQTELRSSLLNNMWLQDRLELVSISSFPALLIVGVCLIIWGALFYHLWGVQEKIDHKGKIRNA